MDVLIHQNETCPDSTPHRSRPAAINLWDVTDPPTPVNLAMHPGDNTVADGAERASSTTRTRSTRGPTSSTGKTYVALIDNDEAADVDILDITDPRNPVLVNDTLDLGRARPSRTQPDTLTSVFSHDMDVQRFGKRYVMNLNYWDGGYVLLDVTDPRGKVQLIAETDYAVLDEERLARGHEIAPEGNAHQSEITPDSGKFLIGTDEDFNPFRVFATIDTGPYAGTEYVAAQASDTPPLTDDNTPITGTPTFVGLACTASPPPAGTGIALVERGVCTFQEKLDNIIAAGYSAGIVFNNVRPDCLSLVTMLADGDIPFVFVNRARRPAAPQAQASPPRTPARRPTPAAGLGRGRTSTSRPSSTAGATCACSRRESPRGPAPAVDPQIDTYAVPESQDAAFATGFGDLTVHEVAMDPNPDASLAYISYYVGRLPGGEVRQRTASRRSAPSSTRAATTSGASRSTSVDGKHVRARQRPRLRPLHLPLHRRVAAGLASGCARSRSPRTPAPEAGDPPAPFCVSTQGRRRS